MAITDDPSIHRRRLRIELRKARESVNLTQREASDALDWSVSKLIRIEAGTQGVSVTDLRAMLQLYKVTDEVTINALTEAARGSRGQSWWSRYREVVSPQLAQYLGHEGSASSIRTFHPLVVPGLLQTDEYATELLRVRVPADRTRRLVDLRIERQENLFERPDPPELSFIIGEEALHRPIGGAAVMRRQLRRLLDVSTLPTTSVQVIPFEAGAHPGLVGPFILLGFGDSGEDVLFLEGAGGDLVNRDDIDMTVQFLEYFETLRSMALPDDEARALIERQIGQFSSSINATPTSATEKGKQRAERE
jgi:transcriptional regulator with XRE-family HTH domain